MPTYDYRCPQCKARDEVTSKMSLIELRVFFCGNCGSEMNRAYTTPPGIILRGSGWASKGG